MGSPHPFISPCGFSPLLWKPSEIFDAPSLESRNRSPRRPSPSPALPYDGPLVPVCFDMVPALGRRRLSIRRSLFFFFCLQAFIIPSHTARPSHACGGLLTRPRGSESRRVLRFSWSLPGCSLYPNSMLPPTRKVLTGVPQGSFFLCASPSSFSRCGCGPCQEHAPFWSPWPRGARHAPV